MAGHEIVDDLAKILTHTFNFLLPNYLPHSLEGATFDIKTLLFRDCPKEPSSLFTSSLFDNNQIYTKRLLDKPSKESLNHKNIQQRVEKALICKGERKKHLHNELDWVSEKSTANSPYQNQSDSSELSSTYSDSGSDSEGVNFNIEETSTPYDHKGNEFKLVRDEINPNIDFANSLAYEVYKQLFTTPTKKTCSRP
jgi:hypothetical protein